MFLYDCLAGDPDWRCTAFIDDGKAGEEHFGVPIFAADRYDPAAGRNALLAVGFPALRRKMVDRLSPLGLEWRTYVDRRSMVGAGAMLGRGVLVLSFAAIASGVRIGDFSYISAYAHAGSRARIGNYVSVMTAAVVGDSVVGDGCTIGLKSACIDGAVIGEGATIAPYTCVRRSAPPGSLVAGPTARIMTRNDRAAGDAAQFRET